MNSTSASEVLRKTFKTSGYSLSGVFLASILTGGGAGGHSPVKLKGARDEGTVTRR